MQQVSPKGDGNEEGEGTRTLVVRAIDGEWIMGDDLILTVTGDETIVEIQQVIKDSKGVPITRMVAFKEEQEARISDKHMTWSLSRNGLYDGEVLVIRPSRPNQWLWHPLEWYEERLLKQAEVIASSSPWAEWGTGCPLSTLQKEVLVPPPLSRTVASNVLVRETMIIDQVCRARRCSIHRVSGLDDSLKGILRKFPDRLRLQLDVVSQEFVAFPNKDDLLLPSSF